MAVPDNPLTVAQRFAAIVESSDDAIVSKDLNGVVLSWNPAAERIFGYTASEMIGRSITTIIPLDRLGEEAEVLSRIRRGDTVEHYETIRRRKDGTLVPISLTVSPIRAPDGRVVGASKIARDISSRRHAEQALATAEARQRDLRQQLMALVAGSGVLFESPLLKDVYPAIILVARSLTAADGYAIWRCFSDEPTWRIGAVEGISQELAERVVATVRSRDAERSAADDPLALGHVQLFSGIAEDDPALDGMRTIVVVPLETAGAREGSLVLYHRLERSIDEAAVQIARAIGNLGGAAIRTAELYEREQRSRDESARAYAHARQANRAKDEFLATLSHELRTPLNAVLGWSRMLRSGTIPASRTARALEVIERNAEAQLRLIEDMLDLSRVITGKLRLDLQPTHLSDAISAAVEALLPAAHAKSIVVSIDPEPNDVVIGDADRLQQVVWNLLSNAIKFTPREGRVSIIIRREGLLLGLEVTDTGEGIDPDVLPYVFDRFRQADSGSTRVHMGLGLGLAIVRHIIEMHGGQVSATSQGKGSGATFRLWLPAATRQQVEAAARPRAPSRATPALAGVRALVVDDDAAARELIVELLEARGVRVDTAATVREAVQALERERPDVILSDLAMPEEDGYDLIRLVRAQPAEGGGRVPAIAVTAYAGPEDARRALSSGFQVHLAKPVDAAELFAAVERLATAGQARSVGE